MNEPVNPQIITPEKRNKRMHTHTVTYQTVEQIMVAVRAIQGRSTRSIAAEFGITESKAQYWIMKAQNTLGTKFRAEYRSGNGDIARAMIKSTERTASAIVRSQITTKWAPFAARRV